MEKSASKNEKLSYRLGDILTRLNSGEWLDPMILACDYNTSFRTIQRDFNERLAYLPLIKEKNCFRLDVNYLGKLDFKDIKSFATLSGIVGMYPSLDKHFIRELLDSRANLTYSSKGQFFEDASQFKDYFDIFSQAIQKHQQIGFLYKDMPRLVQPYRLIHHHGCWYLAAARKGELRAYRLSRIKLPQHRHDMTIFKPDPGILKQLEHEESIWFGIEKQEVILTIHPQVALHFQQRQLLPEQQIIKPLEDGGLLVSSRVVNALQILPLVRYWLPHVRIVNPAALQEQLEAELKGYLE